MKLHHIAIWTFRLEELKEFYVRFLGGKSNEKYVNPKKGFESYFISFGEGPSIVLWGAQPALLPKFGFWQQAKNASASSS